MVYQMRGFWPIPLPLLYFFYQQNHPSDTRSNYLIPYLEILICMVEHFVREYKK